MKRTTVLTSTRTPHDPDLDTALAHLLAAHAVAGRLTRRVPDARWLDADALVSRLIDEALSAALTLDPAHDVPVAEHLFSGRGARQRALVLAHRRLVGAVRASRSGLGADVELLDGPLVRIRALVAELAELADRSI